MAAYFHWRDKPSLVQALAVLAKHPAEMEAIQKFCEKEGEPEGIPPIQNLLDLAAERKLTDMRDFEKLIVEQTLQDL